MVYYMLQGCLGVDNTFYADDGISFSDLRFENDVKMYGTQTKEELKELRD